MSKFKLMKKLILVLIAIICSNIGYGQAIEKEFFKLIKENGHYVFDASINHRVPVRCLLESGIHVMLIDSTFAFNHIKELNLQFSKTSGHEKMNLGGKVYEITHKAKGTIQLGCNAEYSGEIFILPNYQSYFNLAVPIQHLKNSLTNSRIVCLDMEKHELRLLTRSHFKTQIPHYQAMQINYNSYLKMPCINTELIITQDQKYYSLKGNFILDLGNAELLFLIKQNSNVRTFLKKHNDIKIKNAYNKRGKLVAQILISDKLHFGNRNFVNKFIGITSALPRFSSSEGSIGLKYFDGTVCVFDFEKSIFYIQN